MTTIEEKILKVLDLARWAPSGDNSQPWKLQRTGSIVVLSLIPDRDNPILNFKLSGTYIACGAFLENVLIAAPGEGLDAHIDILPDPSNLHIVARIEFSERETSADPLAQYIPERHTNRKPRNKTPLPKEIIEECATAAESIPEVRFRFTVDPAAIRESSDASSVMQKVALETPAIHQLFFGSILWKRGDNEAGKQGLYIDTLELPTPARMMFPLLSHWSLERLFNALGFPQVAAKSNGDLYATAPMHCIITMLEESLRAYIAAGRATQRFWLTATKHHLAVQPVTGVLFLARSIKSGETRNLSPKHIQEIKSADASIKHVFSIEDSEIPAMLFSVGEAPSATTRTFRAMLEIQNI